MRPYKTTDNKIGGAIVALLDIHFLKIAVEETRQRREFAEGIVNTIREPLVVLKKDLTVESVNEAFYRVFKVKPKDTLNRPIYDLGNGQWNIPKLRTLLEEILPQNASFQNFEVEHEFPKIGKKKMVLNARRLTVDGGQTSMIVLAIEDGKDLGYA